MEKVDAAVIGAGVVGLAVAYQLSSIRRDKTIIVVEKNGKPGQETSSRSSEVIHAGIYYPEDSLKTRLCVQGNQLLYGFCERHNVPHRRLGKLIVATCEEEKSELERLYRQGRANGCVLERLNKIQVNRLEPGINAMEGILSPDTGIIDAEELVKTLYNLNRQQGVIQLLRTPMTGIRKLAAGSFLVETPHEEIHTRAVINCAGMFSDQMAAMAGIDIDRYRYRLNYCKGEYYSLPARYRFDHLVYPVPSPYFLGIHLTQDQSGRQRLGPNAYYVDEINYAMDEAYRNEFFEAAHRYIPDLQVTDLQPDYSGIRPKLQGPGQPFRDFVIKEESDKGFPGLINLIGIESPGLTACLAIGGYVSQILSEII